MKHWLLLFTDSKHEKVHEVVTSDVKRSLNFYYAIPQQEQNRRYILVWCCEFPGLDEAQAGYKKLMAFTIDRKKAVIQKSNPKFIELIPRKNLQI